jgi:hypothetical protein
MSQPASPFRLNLAMVLATILLHGLLLAGWMACYVYYFPGDALRATPGSLAATAGPYLVYLIAGRRYGLQASLGNLTPRPLPPVQHPEVSRARWRTVAGTHFSDNGVFATSSEHRHAHHHLSQHRLRHLAQNPRSDPR